MSREPTEAERTNNQTNQYKQTREMKITFKELKIHNFKGITDFTLHFNPTLTNLLGANHTGKTTTADAIHWVLFGKSSEGLAVFGIDPRDGDNNIIHHLDNDVELTLEADGRELALRKVRKETWTKPRGQEEEVLSGHTTDCYINGDKYTIGDYTAEIGKLCPEGLFRAITNPAYFPSLKAESQRELLVKMVGKRTAEEVAEGDSDLQALLKAMSGEDAKAYRQHLSYKMKELKKQLAEIPGRISENRNAATAIGSSGVDFPATRERIEKIDKEIAALDEQLKDSTARLNQDYDKRAAQRRVVIGIKTQISELEDAAERENRKAERKHRATVGECRDEVESLKRQISSLQALNIDVNEAQLQSIALYTEKFRKKWAEVEGDQFSWDSERETCPTCGQRLPEGDIEKLRAEAEEKWSQAHAKAQDELDTEAAHIKRTKTTAEAMLADARKRKAEMEAKLGVAQERLEGAENSVPQEISAADSAEYQDLRRQLAEAEAALDNISGDVEAEAVAKDITARKADLMLERDALRDDLAKESELKSREKRIAELEEEQAQLNSQLTGLEKQDYDAERLEHAIIEDLETRVNGLFPNVRFKMFETALNGNVKPTCVMTLHGVPYQDLSNSERILAGMECTQAMSRNADTYAPLIIDNAEAVNEFPEADSQLILLYVSTNKKLTVVN